MAHLAPSQAKIFADELLAPDKDASPRYVTNPPALVPAAVTMPGMSISSPWRR
jgi:hypothetical protein